MLLLKNIQIKLLCSCFFSRSAKETAKAVTKEFSFRKRIFDSILKILQQCLALMLCKVVIGMSETSNTITVVDNYTEKILYSN